MSKTIVSTSKKWKGSVTLSDPLSLPQAMAWEEALAHARELYPKHEDITDETTPERKLEIKNEMSNIVASADYCYRLIPGICACVEKWELEGLGQVTPETFPSSPKLSSILLMTWLMGEITKLFQEAEEIPNA